MKSFLLSLITSIFAISNNQDVLPNENIVISVEENRMVVHLTTLPSDEAEEVEVTFWKRNPDGSVERLYLIYQPPISPPKNLRLGNKNENQPQ